MTRYNCLIQALRHGFFSGTATYATVSLGGRRGDVAGECVMIPLGSLPLQPSFPAFPAVIFSYDGSKYIWDDESIWLTELLPPVCFLFPCQWYTLPFYNTTTSQSHINLILVSLCYSADTIERNVRFDFVTRNFLHCPYCYCSLVFCMVSSPDQLDFVIKPIKRNK